MAVGEVAVAEVAVGEVGNIHNQLQYAHSSFEGIVDTKLIYVSTDLTGVVPFLLQHWKLSFWKAFPNQMETFASILDTS